MYQVKMLGFMHLYCEKLYLWPETWTREGLNRHPGGWRCKRHGGLKI